MRTLSQIVIVVFGLMNFAQAQVPPSITYDSLSGDWIITYQGSQGPIEAYFVPAMKIDPTVRSEVEDGDTLRYRFAVTNGASSRQRLLNFLLSVRSSVFNVSRPNSQWHSESSRFLRGWEWGHTLVNRDGGPSLDMGIPRDSTVGGFSVESFGLPSIVNCYFQGLTGTMTFEEEPPIEVEDLLRPLETFPANEVLLRTIGPVDPPTPFNGHVFLDTLLSYARQSAQLGWLGRYRDDDCDEDERPDDGVVRNIENRLQKARRELVRGDSVKARRELEKLIRKVDRLQRRGERVMTSESYALLKYNTEYLIERLPERRRR